MKGELSLQVVVMAVVAILILVLLVWIVGGKLGLFNKSVSDCESRGGHCTDSCSPGEQPNYLASCDDGVCCVSKSRIFEDLTGQQG